MDARALDWLRSCGSHGILPWKKRMAWCSRNSRGSRGSRKARNSRAAASFAGWEPNAALTRLRAWMPAHWTQRHQPFAFWASFGHQQGSQAVPALGGAASRLGAVRQAAASLAGWGQCRLTADTGMDARAPNRPEPTRTDQNPPEAPEPQSPVSQIRVQS